MKNSFRWSAISNRQIVISVRFLLFSIFIFQFSILNAQTVKRIELPAKYDEQAYQVIPLEKSGVLLVTRTGKLTFNTTKFDENLEQIWSVDGELEGNENYIDYSREGNNIYLLFSKSNNSFYQIIKVTTSIGLLQKFTFEGLKNFEISEFKVHNDNAYIAGMVKEEPVLFRANFKGDAPRVIAGGLQGTSSIQSVNIDSLTNDVNISYSVKKGKANFVVVKKINDNGKMIDQIVFQPEADLALLTGKMFSLNDSTELMVGNYGFKGYQSNGAPMSQGLYISKVNSDSPDDLIYYSFTDFKNFFKFLPEKEQAKIERKIEKKKEKGEDLKLNYRILVHDIIQKNGQYILVAEIFYPEFRYNSSYYGSGFGSPYSSFGSSSMMYMSSFSRYYYGMNSWAWNPWLYGNNNRGQIFDGFKYTHAIVAGFDKSGKLLWDNSIGFDEVKSMELKEKIKVKVGENDITLVYSNKGKLNSKIIQGNDVIESNKFIDLSSDKDGDKVKATDTDDIQYWHDNYYLAWGNQRIANKNEGKRNVFYLSKIMF